MASLCTLLLLAEVGLFLFSCLVLPTDAQGVFIFIFTLPIMFLLWAAVALLCGHRGERTPARRILRINHAFMIFVGLFFVSAPIPGLQLIPMKTVEWSSTVFQQLAGTNFKTWYRSHFSNEYRLEQELVKSGGQASNLRDTFKFDWDEVCVFTPYTSDDEASTVLGSPLKLSAKSTIANDDSFNAVVLFKNKSPVEVFHLSRARFEFSEKSSRCYGRAEAIIPLAPVLR